MANFIEDVLTSATQTVRNGIANVNLAGLGLGNQSSLRANTLSLKPEYALQIACPELGIYFKAPLPPEFDWASSAEYDTPMKDFIGDTLSSAGTVGRVADVMARANGIQLVTQALTAKFWSGSSSAAITIPCILQANSDEVEEVLKPLVNLKALTLPRLAGGRKGSVLQAPGPHFDLQKAYNMGKAKVSSAIDTKSVAGKPTTSASSVASSVFDTLGKFKSAIQPQLDLAAQGDFTAASRGIVDGAYRAGEAVDDFLRSSTRNAIIVQIGNYIRLPSVVITDVQDKHHVQPVGRGPGQSSGNMQRVELSISFEPFYDLTLNDLADVFLDSRVRAYVNTLIGNASGDTAINGFF